MPTDAPAVKRAATKHYGGQVVTYDRERESREAIGCRLAEERGLAVIPPFDHPDVIAGAGTVGLEILEDWPDVDIVLVPIGGGGLISGIALAVRGASTSAEVVGVEVAASSPFTRGLEARIGLNLAFYAADVELAASPP